MRCQLQRLRARQIELGPGRLVAKRLGATAQLSPHPFPPPDANVLIVLYATRVRVNEMQGRTTTPQGWYICWYNLPRFVAKSTEKQPPPAESLIRTNAPRRRDAL